MPDAAEGAKAEQVPMVMDAELQLEHKGLIVLLVHDIMLSCWNFFGLLFLLFVVWLIEKKKNVFLSTAKSALFVHYRAAQIRKTNGRKEMFK